MVDRVVPVRPEQVRGLVGWPASAELLMAWQGPPATPDRPG
ncbi:hypothetical protein F4559_004284 [Saccharothrix violaceirubra]|uniref:Uncharacterized protein n=1 Tax=Saccharothrix violaceirubra TaxID=413306 RepID=A0A7W7T5H6_9PSEU|nr:hypothetical protein [Saccharothrix violaceirubra]